MGRAAKRQCLWVLFVSLASLAPLGLAQAEERRPAVHASRSGGRGRLGAIECAPDDYRTAHNPRRRAECERRRTDQVEAYCDAALGLPEASSDPAPPRPNIVLIVTDDQRWDTLDVMPTVTDRLVDQGLDFANGFVSNPLCGPSRAAILTGQYAHRNGVTVNSVFQLDAEHTLATALQAAGYTTALFGKYMNLYEVIGDRIPPGWSRWHALLDEAYFDYRVNDDGEIVQFGSAPEDYSTDVLAEAASEFIASHADRPFFLLFTTFAPHRISRPAPRHAGLFASRPAFRPPSFHEPDASDKPTFVLWNRILALRSELLQPGVRIASFDARIRSDLESLVAVDEAVDRLLATLEANGLERDTLVIFTSDNGYLYGEHWLHWKSNPYEESIRVPMLMRYPRMITAGARSEEIALNIDLAPTIAALAGARLALPVDGIDLAPQLCGGAQRTRTEFLIENYIPRSFDATPAYLGLRTRDWKYVRNLAGFEELYNLRTDPGELDNLLVTLAGDPFVRALADAFEDRMDQLIAGYPDPSRPAP